MLIHTAIQGCFFFFSAGRRMVSERLKLLITKSMPTWEKSSYTLQGVSEPMSKNWVQSRVVYPRWRCCNQCKGITMSVEHWTPLTDNICFGIPKSLLRISWLTGIVLSFFHYFGIFTLISISISIQIQWAPTSSGQLFLWISHHGFDQFAHIITTPSPQLDSGRSTQF